MSKTSGEPTKGNVLVVDDNKDNVRFLVSALTREGYVVRPALDGPLALAAIQKEIPDLILLDVRMSDMDGYEVCEKLKADPDTRDVHIIFISALDDVTDKVRGFSVGGVDYITKPFQIEEVLARVHTHLELRNLQKALEDKNTHLERTNEELRKAAAEIKTLRGILPICSNCKNIRDDKGYWNQIEAYISDHSETEFTHSFCPKCAKELYPQYYRED